MKVELNKSDYNKVQAKLAKLKAIDRTLLSTEIGRGALNIARDIKKIAPVDTGNLRLAGNTLFSLSSFRL